MIFFAEAYLSSLIGQPVRDAAGEFVGRLHDLVVTREEPFPVVTKLVVKPKRRREALALGWEMTKSVSREGFRLSVGRGEIVPAEMAEGEVLLAGMVLDRQIVDVRGTRVVRVADLQLAALAGQVRLVAAEVGTRGLLRRLGLEWLVQMLYQAFGSRLQGSLISWEHVQMLESPVMPLQLARGYDRLGALRPADLADVASQLSAGERAHLFRSLDDETAADALGETTPEVGASVLNAVGDEKASDILEEMAPDDAADLLGQMPDERAMELLGKMEPEERADVQELLAYPEDTAGGLMTTEYIELKETMTAQQVIERLRELAPDEGVAYYLYVTDESERLVGVLPLRSLVVAAPEQRISELMDRDVVSVTLETRGPEVAQAMSKYNLFALPVVDKEGKLQGIVTVDDVMEAVLPAPRGRPSIR
jgi:CBS domain-containing protein